MVMAPLDDRLATMVSAAVMLEKTAAGTGHQDHQTEQLSHPNLKVRNRPQPITAA